jgi:hypothetical protein
LRGNRFRSGHDVRVGRSDDRSRSYDIAADAAGAELEGHGFGEADYAELRKVLCIMEGERLVEAFVMIWWKGHAAAIALKSTVRTYIYSEAGPSLQPGSGRDVHDRAACVRLEMRNDGAGHVVGAFHVDAD